MRIGSTLKDLRMKKKLKQKEVADSLGITAVAYNRFENDNRKPSYELLILIADFFEVDVGYFFYRDDIDNGFILIRILFNEYLNTYIEINKLGKKYLNESGSRGSKLTLTEQRLENELEAKYLHLQSLKSEINQFTNLKSFDLFIDDMWMKGKVEL
ncbi:HTH-type transcriptional regulator Xre [Candidatus Izimaplasma bacterium HR1]|jgi:transcriptional regulator with XRE-family HTH domain|uniref:helix-turn-helix domain-containing protein n=1 Tax=Candidatus Izimoplasma sp. HR1 TaxID=1541959 RepID=UPI0004F5F145|nr:HTH-type transcriptional regulator Xre [Candidatus Izimaplasma bacterium HR1]